MTPQQNQVLNVSKITFHQNQVLKVLKMTSHQKHNSKRRTEKNEKQTQLNMGVPILGHSKCAKVSIYPQHIITKFKNWGF